MGMGEGTIFQPFLPTRLGSFPHRAPGSSPALSTQAPKQEATFGFYPLKPQEEAGCFNLLVGCQAHLPVFPTRGQSNGCSRRLSLFFLPKPGRTWEENSSLSLRMNAAGMPQRACFI